MAHDPIMEKIRKLLALAESADEHEAAAATAAAQRLMTRHAVDASMLRDAPGATAPRPPIGRSVLHSAARIPHWRKQLSMAVADATGCAVYLARGRGLMVVGAETDRTMAALLYASLARQVDAATRRTGAGAGASWCATFRRGAVDRLRTRLQEAARAECLAIRAEAVATHGTGSALARVDQALARVDARGSDARDWMREVIPNMRKGRASQQRYAGEGAYNAGVDAANRMDIRGQRNALTGAS